MSLNSASSNDNFCSNTKYRRTAHSSRNCRKKINISFQELTSDESDESNEPVNTLTNLVRETYLSYLVKILSSNYKSYSTNNASSQIIFSERDIEQCAAQMEQKALRSSIVARLYQRAMLRMIGEIKRHTELKKPHVKLCSYSQLSYEKGTQTESILPEYPKSRRSTDGLEKQSSNQQTAITPSYTDTNGNASFINDLITRSLACNSANHWPPQTKRATNKLVVVNKPVFTDLRIPEVNKSPVDLQKFSADNDVESLFHSYSESDECADHNEIENALESTLITINKSSVFEAANNGQVLQGTSMQIKSTHMQSLDERLAALKFDNLNTFALGEFSPENTNDETNAKEEFLREDSEYENDEMSHNSQESPGLSTLDKQLAEIHGESGSQSISKDTKKPEADKTKKKLVWRYEEIYYMKRLRLKLKSLSTAKRIKLEHHLQELFVDCGNVNRKVRERPVLQDPLLEFKDRIKPWVVRHLMPFYKTGKIESRDFFKHVARHITDSLVEINHFPDEADVIDGINLLLNA